MTKPELTDPATKCSLSLEEAGKTDLEHIGKMLENNALAIRRLETIPQLKLKQRETEPMKTNPGVAKLDIFEGKIHNMESGSQPEKAPKIDLDLYQMEEF